MRIISCISCIVVALGFRAVPQTHLWDGEPGLWDMAQQYTIVRPLSSTCGLEGPAGFSDDIAIAPSPSMTGPQGSGINLSNGELKIGLWGTADKLVLSIDKTDVWRRTNSTAAEDEGKTKKPVGQFLLLAGDFLGAAQPAVTTALHSGVSSLRITRGGATADLQYLTTRRETNVIAVKAECSGMTRALTFRLYRHNDGDLPARPVSGNDGEYFWIRQDFPADSTFPNGFHYYFAAKVTGESAVLQNVTNQSGLGATVPFRSSTVAGSAATATIPVKSSVSVVVYATVVTTAEAADPLAEARARLAAAQTSGFEGLAAANQSWFQALFTRREQGRIFTGIFDDVKNVVLPYFFQGSWQNRHTYTSSPDPAKFEGDACYNALEQDNVEWSGVPCFNEEIYTGDYVAGRNESIAPYYVKLYNYWLPAFRMNAQTIGKPGWMQLRGYLPPVRPRAGFSSYFGNVFGDPTRDWATMVWGYKNVWDDFDYGGKSDAFLADSVYPGLRDMADFFAALVVPGSDGYYHLNESQVREEEKGRDAIDCIAAVKWAFRTAVRASSILGVDAARRADWQGKLDRMAPYGVLNDRWVAIYQNNQPSFGTHGYSHYMVNVADEYNLESSAADKDRCIRSLRAIHYTQPMHRQVEALLGRAQDTLYGGGSDGGYSLNWIHMFAYPSWLMFYALRSNNGDFCSRAMPLTTRARKVIACWLEPERLCNSRSGTIHFFPCVPSSFDVAFKDFQARGGFLVTGELRGGSVTYAHVKARRTGNCAVMNPWPGKGMYVFRQSDNGAVTTTRDGERYSFAAVAGTEYALSTSATPVRSSVTPSAGSAMIIRVLPAAITEVADERARGIEILTASGALAARGSRTTLRAALRPGMYVVKVTTQDGFAVRRIAVR